MIYYDVTDLMAFCHRHTEVTGIQRAGTMTLGHFAEFSGHDSCRMIAHHVEKWRIVTAPIAHPVYRPFDAMLFLWHTDVRFIGAAESDEELSRWTRWRKRKSTHERLEILDRLLPLPRLGRRHGGARVRRARWRAPDLGPDDVVYLPGGLWGRPDYMDDLERMQAERGFRIVLFVHDLIPLVAGQYLSDTETSRQFDAWLRRMCRMATRFLTCSEATRRDLEAFIAAADLPRVPISVVPHAHELLLDPAAPASVRPLVREASRRPYALCVGTLEARKNNAGLLAAWQRLVAERGEAAPRLIFAGKRGWRNEAFFEALAASDRLGGRVEIVDNPSDHELAHLYANCLFSVFPSFYEGWGLPIGESLWYGRPVIASNTSAMPEVGGDVVDYVDPTSPASFDRALALMLDAGHRARREAAIAALPKRRWRDVAARVWSELTEVAAGPRRADETTATRANSYPT